MNAEAVAIIVSAVVSTFTMVATRLWVSKKKMNAKELRTLASELNDQARINIRRGMAPLHVPTTTALNPNAPFARAPQPALPPLEVAQQRPALVAVTHTVMRLEAPPAPADPAPPAEGTFFWPGQFEEEIKKEREGR